MGQQICIVPQLSGLGGMVSFQARFIQGLNTRGIAHSFDLTDPKNTSILVIGGTRHLWKLWQAKQRGVPVVQRLNGMNWMHRVQRTPLHNFLRAELNNRLLSFIRRHISHKIIYQSIFSQDWWVRVFGDSQNPKTVIYNGVDLEIFSPEGPESPPANHDRILLVEGHLSSANAGGLQTAVRLAQAVKDSRTRPVELMVVGDVSDSVKAQAHSLAPDVWITWRGVLPSEAIPALDRSAHLLFSADLNAACPNSVIEAVACGLPVLAYDTGALGELVQSGAGKIVPYGADYWQLEDPIIPPLATACIHLLENNPAYRKQARERAESTFGLDTMIDAYIAALEI